VSGVCISAEAIMNAATAGLADGDDTALRY
jgi:hypothetical protein